MYSNVADNTMTMAIQQTIDRTKKKRMNRYNTWSVLPSLLSRVFPLKKVLFQSLNFGANNYELVRNGERKLCGTNGEKTVNWAQHLNWWSHRNKPILDFDRIFYFQNVYRVSRQKDEKGLAWIEPQPFLLADILLGDQNLFCFKSICFSVSTLKTISVNTQYCTQTQHFHYANRITNCFSHFSYRVDDFCMRMRLTNFDKIVKWKN